VAVYEEKKNINGLCDDWILRGGRRGYSIAKSIEKVGQESSAENFGGNT
jgi:hypothetical protein